MDFLADANKRSLFNAILVICFSSFLLSWVWKAVNWVWIRPRKLEKCLREQGFAGEPYRFLVGDIRESNALDKRAHSAPQNLSEDTAPRVLPLIHKTVQKYGSRCFTWLGPIMNVVITEPEAMREVLSNYMVFQKPSIGHPIEDIVGGLVAAEGDLWSKYRNLSDPGYRMDKLKTMIPVLSLSCEEMMNEWGRLMSSNKSIELDMWPYSKDLARDMLARVVFGRNYSEGVRIFVLQRQQVDLLLQTLRSVYIPGQRYLPTKFNRTLWKLGKQMKTSLKRMIVKRVEEMNKGVVNDGSLLGSLLNSNSKLVQQEGEAAGLTMDELIELCEDYYLAGENGNSAFLLWTMVLLSRHQEWQDRAREEIFQVFGDRKPDFAGLNQLKVVNMILHEVLRMYPPAHYSQRLVRQDTKVCDFFLPAGVFVCLPFLLFHRNPDLWGPDVNEFKPERFESGVFNATKGQLAFLPFGNGPRTCIGQNLGLVEAKVAFVMILRSFVLKPSPSYIHAPYPSITTVPQHKVPMILQKI